MTEQMKKCTNCTRGPQPLDQFIGARVIPFQHVPNAEKRARKVTHVQNVKNITRNFKRLVARVTRKNQPKK